ncbi:MAG: deoxyribodipyrimidine photo-lyase [Actinomycetes bacterium]
MATSRSVLWFRRDLRLADNPALLAAEEAGEEVVPLFVVDPALWGPAGDPRRAYLVRSLRHLDSSIGDTLLIRHGDPVRHVVEVARAVGATSVHAAADFGPYGRRRDEKVAAALAEAGITFTTTGSPYAVAPGRVTKPDGTPYRVYTPFLKAWANHGWRHPAESSGRDVNWAMPLECDGYPDEPTLGDVTLPEAGEAAALRRWDEYLSSGHLDRYDDDRNRPDLDATSRLSVHLKYGEIHPRTLLADLGDGTGHNVFRKELAWREFYADVLWHRPDSARDYLRPEFAGMSYDRGPRAEERLLAWQQGRTGYPIVDAGMSQLLAEGWMHNRVRMIVASFLVKDLHLEWTAGARWFMRHLVDGDVASNAHGWQWVAGCGTDAAPYFRVFNPVTQGLRFDPDGSYVRRFVPELRHLDGAAAHEPWTAVDGYSTGYPERIVDHSVERASALSRYGALKASM